MLYFVFVYIIYLAHCFGTSFEFPHISASANVTQLVWLENPRSFYLTPDWDVHVLNENVEDVHFRLHDLPLNGVDTTVVISSGFYR